MSGLAKVQLLESESLRVIFIRFYRIFIQPFLWEDEMLFFSFFFHLSESGSAVHFFSLNGACIYKKRRRCRDSPQLLRWIVDDCLPRRFLFQCIAGAVNSHACLHHSGSVEREVHPLAVRHVCLDGSVFVETEDFALLTFCFH